MSRALISLFLLSLFACESAIPQSRSLDKLLSDQVELLGDISSAKRTELYNETVRRSNQEAGRPGASLFLIFTDGGFRAAPGLNPGKDLLTGLDAGSRPTIVFDESNPFSEERRETYGGLSEKEAAEFVTLALLQAWGLNDLPSVKVVRTPSSGYAAAYVDGVLRLNPSFLFVATAPRSAT